MKAGTLYTFAGNFRALKPLIAAGYSNVDLAVDNSFVFGSTNKSEEFLKNFPNGKVPTYESKDKSVHLSESDAISYYVANEALKGGKCEVGQAKVIQWTNFAQGELYPAICGWLFPSLSIMQFNKDNVAKAQAEVERCLSVLDEYLMTRTYFVGEQITLADIALFATLLDLYKNLLDKETRNSYINVCRWFDTILNQPKVKEVMKKNNFDFSYCDTPVKFDGAKFKDICGGGQQQGKKEDKKKKEEKPKQQPKQEKKPEPEEEPDAADAAYAEEPKSKDPLDLLPKGNFVMDDFKRFYSNNDVDKSVPYFWEKFDPEHYSIWIGEYSYNSELTKVFMSCNLIAGMFQRLEKLRKNAFASCCLFGEDNNSTISGLWVWRGQDLAFELSPDWQIDYSSYTWKKLDPSTPETKKLVQDYFSWEGADTEGRKFNQGKIFK